MLPISGDESPKERVKWLDGLPGNQVGNFMFYWGRGKKTRSSWLNCALRNDEAVYWVSIGHYEAVAVGN